MNATDLDIASRAIGFAVAVFAAAFAVLRFGFGVGKRDTSIEATITAGFESIRGRLDRIERSREDEQRKRALAAAAAQQRAIEDAVRRAQAEEREKTFSAAIGELRGHVENLIEAKQADHQEFRERMSALEASAKKLDEIDGHQRGHSKSLQDLQLRVGTIERRISSTRPAMTRPMDPRGEPESGR